MLLVIYPSGVSSHAGIFRAVLLQRSVQKAGHHERRFGLFNYP